MGLNFWLEKLIWGFSMFEQYVTVHDDLICYHPYIVVFSISKTIWKFNKFSQYKLILRLFWSHVTKFMKPKNHHNNKFHQISILAVCVTNWLKRCRWNFMGISTCNSFANSCDCCEQAWLFYFPFSHFQVCSLCICAEFLDMLEDIFTAANKEASEPVVPTDEISPNSCHLIGLYLLDMKQHISWRFQHLTSDFENLSCSKETDRLLALAHIILHFMNISTSIVHLNWLQFSNWPNYTPSNII